MMFSCGCTEYLGSKIVASGESNADEQARSSKAASVFGTQALSERRPRSNYTLLLWLLRHCMLVKPGERLQGMKIK